MWQKSKLIKDLRRQVPLDIIINEIIVGVYITDYVYIDIDPPRPLEIPGGADWPTAGVKIYEDWKGMDQPLSRFKRKALEASRGITIYITGVKKHG